MSRADGDAKLSARGKDRVGIDIVADLAGNVGIARRHEIERDESGLERLVREGRADRRH